MSGIEPPFSGRSPDASEVLRLREALRDQHVQNLEFALALAESDPLYAEIFRPYFKRILDLAGAAGMKPPFCNDRGVA